MTPPGRTASPSIRMGEMSVARDDAVMRTLLGSCVGIALYDRKLKVGGLAHIVLPQSRGNKDRPGKFVDTAIPALIDQMQKLADQELRLIAKIAGGASMFSSASGAGIGRQNIETCEQALRERRIPIVARHCFGEQGRRMTFHCNDGSVTIEIVGQDPLEL